MGVIFPPIPSFPGLREDFFFFMEAIVKILPVTGKVADKS